MVAESFSFKSLNIIPEEIEELMGFERGEAPEPFPDLIRQGISMAEMLCHGTGGYIVFPDVTVDHQKETITIEGRVFHPGKTVTRELKDATMAALFLCTAGSKISALAKEQSEAGDDLAAYVFDVIGSVAADKVAARINQLIGEEACLTGLGISDSFSPGYCNWSVSEQQILFSLMPGGFCGITLSGSSLMDPVKSVSGITGIGPGLQQKGYQCNWCSDSHCIYGKIRRSKKAKKSH